VNQSNFSGQKKIPYTAAGDRESENKTGIGMSGSFG